MTLSLWWWWEVGGGGGGVKSFSNPTFELSWGCVGIVTNKITKKNLINRSKSEINMKGRSKVTPANQ